MGLNIYSSPKEETLFSDNNPFTITFDGRIGGSQDRLVYIRNNDTTRYYTDIKIQAIDSIGDNIVDGSTSGFMWKLMEKDIVPTNEEWNLISPGNILSLSSNLGNSLLADISTYLPMWIRVTIPRGQRIKTIIDVKLRLTATEISI